METKETCLDGSWSVTWGLGHVLFKLFSRFFLGRKLDELHLLYMNWHMTWIVEFYDVFFGDLYPLTVVFGQDPRGFVPEDPRIHSQGATSFSARIFKACCDDAESSLHLLTSEFFMEPRRLKKNTVPQGAVAPWLNVKIIFFQIVDDSCSWFDRTGVVFIVFFGGWRCLWNAFNLHLHTLQLRDWRWTVWNILVPSVSNFFKDHRAEPDHAMNEFNTYRNHPYW